ncbi:MAG: glycosyltransferase family 4 protein [Rubrivivax sp.]|nr:glycosyltransferase family 4 protein [Rubrivivax sp.]
MRPRARVDPATTVAAPWATVAFVQRRLPHYRVPLLEAMRARLAGRGIALRFLHGAASPGEESRHDAGTLAWAEPLPARYWAGGRIVWQPFLHRVAGCELVIVSQENKLVHNVLALADPRRRAALAFFGHGRNLQADAPGGAREWFKRQTTRRADWWYAYTRGSADIVAAAGFPRERITVVDNAIDTIALREAIERARGLGVAANRRALGLPEHGPLVAFVGSLHADRRVPRLVELAAGLRRARPDVHVAVAGDGPLRARVDAASISAGGVLHPLGAVDGARKALLLAACDLVLNPGAAGLGVLDAFAAGVPMVTVADARHGPEVAYVEHGRNGLVLPDADLLPALVRLLDDTAERERLGAGAQAAGGTYTIERMGERFCTGIEACLEAQGRR